MRTLCFVFLAVWLLRVVFCVSGLLRARYYRNKYLRFLKNPQGSFYRYTAAIKKIFKQAGVPDLAVYFSQPVGYGRVLSAPTNIFDNMGSTHKDVAKGMNITEPADNFYKLFEDAV